MSAQRFRRRLIGPSAESTRIRLLRQGIVQSNIDANSVYDPTPARDCIILAQPTIQVSTTPNQLSFTLDKAIACPILYKAQNTFNGCQPVFTTPIPPMTGPGVEPPQGPSVTDVYRRFERIRGIEQISKPVVGRAGSDHTAALRTSIESASITRYSQTVIPVIPYPPYIPRPSGPQPGVPPGVSTPCNLANRRVDYSNPKA
jgi:hypothetical protein